MLDRLRDRLSAFRSCNRALAGVEFAMIAPLLVTLFIGTLDLARYITVLKRVQNAASDIALSVSASDKTISGSTLWQLYHMVPILIPDLMTDLRLSGLRQPWFKIARMNISFITVRNLQTSCGDVCPQEAKVAWSYGYDRRACGVIPPNSETPVPKQYGVAQPSNLISVEIRYAFEPMFLKFLQPFDIVRVSYVPPRFVDVISVEKLGDVQVSIGDVCT